MIPSPNGTRALSDAQIERFARQIIVPGIGADGQSRLCAAEVLVDGHPEGRRAAAQYLRAAGVTVCACTSPPPRLDCVVLAGSAELVPARMRMLVASAPLLAWYSVVDNVIRGGLADATHPIPDAGRRRNERPTPRIVMAHRIGGADVATTVMGALLGWIRPGDSYELELA